MPNSTQMNNRRRIRAYLKALEDGAGADTLRGFFSPDATQLEYPNLFNPRGGENDLETILQRAEHARVLMTTQTFEIVSEMAQGPHVVLEVVWSGTLALDLDQYKSGTVLRAHLGLFFDMAEGLIKTQRNYNCFEALDKAKRASA